MTGRIAAIWRHPIKAHGREALDLVTLEAGLTMPGDRVWAVAHAASKAGSETWAPCVNFSRAAKAPGLQAIRSVWDEATGRIRLTHPERPEIELDPDTEADRLIDWVRPLMPPDRAPSARVVRVPGRGMTDTDFPSISLIGAASNDALSAWIGADLSPERWRANFLVEGLAPWAEFDLVGKTISLGGAQVEVRARITRCRATCANTATGMIDADTLGALEEGWGHQDFGVYGVVAQGGRVALGDTVQVAT